ncbi:MAG: hypothetical protein F4X79_04195 [Acidobacteria bacterium]|nr:hypothetical protein [Acidobacteriota bacterium]
MTMSNLDRYRKDLESLVSTGDQLVNSIQAECHPKEFLAAAKKKLGARAEAFVAGLPSFAATYQRWYSEAQVLVRQLLPERLADFVRHYEKPKSRKNITFENYRIEDTLQGLEITRSIGLEKKRVVGPEAGIPHFQQQLAILRAVEARFESSLFDIRQLVMADLFDSELDAASELAKKKFLRAAGAVAGVVLEKHLIEVCSNRAVSLGRKKATIGNLNESLRTAGVVDVAQWRFVQHLGDIRNTCDHSKGAEPTAEQVDDLIAGVNKTLKTLF